MSGGVDSSTTAALLVEQGHEVTGVHMMLHEEKSSDSTCDAETKTCCGVDDATDAARVCRRLNIPFYKLNFKKVFDKYVIQYFRESYERGETPNPCVACNEYIKFQLLLNYSRKLGFDALATGHYCKNDGSFLSKAADPLKDQSYFLWPIKKQDLPFIMFPLGNMTKVEVREHAERFGLITAKKKDSQDVCFIPDGDYRNFLSLPIKQGEYLFRNQPVGHHNGFWNFTIGQRKGLFGINQRALRSLTEDNIYVRRIDVINNIVHLDTIDNIGEQIISLREMNIFDYNVHSEVTHAKLRHGQASIDIDQLTFLDREYTKAEIRLVGKSIIMPGQSVVIYKENKILAGGIAC